MKQKKLSLFEVEKIITEKNLAVFTPAQFGRLFDISRANTKYFLETYSRKGFFSRLKRGLYALEKKMPGEEEIANALYRPSYVSFEYAMAKYGIIPEMVYAVTSATTKPTRNFTSGQREFSYFKIKKQAFAGYSLAREENKSILIADPEKSLVDYLYFVSLGKKPRNDRLNTKHLNKNKVLKYARLYKRPGLVNLVQAYDFR